MKPHIKQQYNCQTNVLAFSLKVLLIINSVIADSSFRVDCTFQVNGQKMNGKSQAEAVNTLRSTRGLVTLLVQREEAVQSPRMPAMEVSITKEGCYY